ncbi:Ca2+-transporting ATPase [Formivibrio citricus]|uniref:Ca2+-transporting ATPase n=1 Tax=Formivibrio citricus TaxID=83765 RepID=A0A1I4WC45_9NEIS|nr:cation-translocating P-type ATPase [Formivibrio citricus]SFN10820.1 Ca2+-transporting ATPase [Formivibrio citricus]
MAQTQLPLPPYRLPVDAIQESAQSNLASGLSTTEANHRLQIDGPNELPAAPPVPGWIKFLRQFTDPLTVLLLCAMGISLLAWFIEGESGLPYETITILIIVLLNATLGFMQERRAEEAVAALQAMSAPTASVLRDGEQQAIAAREVVTGDILLIEEGDTLPADARVIESISLRVAEAALTGESAPVSKDPQPIQEEAGIGDQENMVFSGTAVTSGRGRALVVATGADTEIGRIAGSLHATQDEPTPLQKELAKVGHFLGRSVIAIALVMGLTLLWIYRAELSLGHFVAILMFSVSLAVAAVPEGLTAINTIILSLGMARMAKRNVIVRKLNSVETLGSTTVICSDKTGTLTRNEMTVRSVIVAGERVDFSGIGYEPSGTLHQQGQPLSDPVRDAVERALHTAELANNAKLIEQDGRWSIQGDPTEAALIVAARKAGITRAQLDARYTRIGEVPFSSERKMMSTAQLDIYHAGHIRMTSKGAPDILLSRCTHEWIDGEDRPLTPERRTAILTSIEDLAQEALRTLGVAYRLLHRDALTGNLCEEHENEMVFLGVIGMIDPPRPEAAAAVAEARAAGIRPIMITGDHQITAAAIAIELGIVEKGAHAVTGAELQRMNDKQLRQTVKTCSVFARVAPEHKLRIVTALQAEGAIAAMTGDGVNDAPALKKSDIGVAMGITGTDVSKGAADMVLTDDNFASIVAAVEEGRTIFANIQKFLRFLLSSNIGEVFFMFFGVLLAGVIGLKPESGLGITVPLLAVQILWVNLLTDSGPALALGVDPVDHDVMRQTPRDPRTNIITPAMWLDIMLVGIIMAIGTLAVTDWVLPGGLIPGGTGNMARAQTMAFNTLVFYQLFNAFNARSETRSAFHGVLRNGWLWIAIAIAILLQIAVIHLPFLQTAFKTEALTAQEWVISIVTASSVLWLMELKKLYLRRQ